MANTTKTTNTTNTIPEAPKFKVPEEFKKVLYRDWPQNLKDEYQAYRKAGYARIEAIKNEKWDKLEKLVATNAEALAIVKDLREGTTKKPGAVDKLFGKSDIAVGDTVDFDMTKLMLIQRVQDKGYVLEIKNNKVVVVALPAA